jgi:AcrR family transcriptional regulator
MARAKAISDKSAIIKASMEILKAEGIDALSIRRIGAKINVSGMTLYNYVENIDDIKREIILEGFRELYRNGYEALRTVKKYDGLIRIDEGCRILAKELYLFGVLHPHLFELMFCTNSGKFRKDAEIEPFYGFFRNLLHRRSAQNGKAGNDQALNMLDHITNSMIIERIRGVNNTTEEDYFEHVNEYISKMF